MSVLIEPMAENDIAVIKWQIGSEDISVATVKDRCQWNYPRVLLMRPLRDIDHGRPERSSLDFRALSNLLWLTCPYLNEKIHELESAGYIARIEEFIASDREIMTSMNNAHAHNHYLRKRLFEKFMGQVVPLDVNEIFNTGIGGISDAGHVKCLHIHFAHYRLCEENVVGRIVTMLLDDTINCDDCRCAAWQK